MAKIEAIDEIEVPKFDPLLPGTSRQNAMKSLQEAFELAFRKKGITSVTELHLKFHAFFKREEIAKMGRRYQQIHKIDLGLFGNKGMRAQLEYLEVGVREFLLGLKAKNSGVQAKYVVVKSALEGINRSIIARGASLGHLSPKAAEAVFVKVNAELGHPVKAVYRDLAHFGKVTGPAPKLSVRSKTNILRTARHPPPFHR